MSKKHLEKLQKKERPIYGMDELEKSWKKLMASVTKLNSIVKSSYTDKTKILPKKGDGKNAKNV